MEPIHIFYKELPVNESNIFTGNLPEVRFKKSKEYAITGLSINQDIIKSEINLLQYNHKKTRRG